MLPSAKPAEVGQGDSVKETCREGLLPHGEGVRKKKRSLALQWQIPSELHHQAASSLGPPPPTSPLNGPPLTRGHCLSGLLPSSVHWLYLESGSRPRTIICISRRWEENRENTETCDTKTHEESKMEMGCFRQKGKDSSLEMKTGRQKTGVPVLIPSPPGLCASLINLLHVALRFSAETTLTLPPNSALAPLPPGRLPSTYTLTA